MTEPIRSSGECLFEKYLVNQGITDWKFEKEHAGRNKHPDYTVTIDREYLFEIKEFEHKNFPENVGSYNPYINIREKIAEGRKKFKEFKELPCSLVLYNSGNAPLVHLENPHIMFGAMLGDLGICTPFNPATRITNSGTARLKYLYNGKMLSPKSNKPRNTTISAVITLRYIAVGRARMEKHMNTLKKKRKVTIEDWLTIDVDFDRNERQIGVIVWENPFARIPFSRELFQGPYDERYEFDDENLTRRIFVGAEVERSKGTDQ